MANYGLTGLKVFVHFRGSSSSNQVLMRVRELGIMKFNVNMLLLIINF